MKSVLLRRIGRANPIMISNAINNFEDKKEHFHNEDAPFIFTEMA